MSAKDDKHGQQKGGVRHDARGNAVWEWAVDTGKHALDSTSRLLKRLEVPGLKLEGESGETGETQAPGEAGTGAPAKPDREVGYNPYGAAGSAAPARPAAGAARAVRPVAATKPAAGTTPKPSLLQRLLRKP